MGASRSIVPSEDRSQAPSDAADRVLEYIRKNPGCHLRRIRQELGIAMGTVQYQTGRLEKAGKISSTRLGLYRLYFPAGTLDKEKDLLQVLRQETARDILIFIIERGNPTHSEISDNVAMSSASVNWHIRRLVDLNLIYEEKDGKYKRYLSKGDAKLIISLMKNYYPSIWDKWSNRLAEMFLSMSAQAVEKREEQP